ncbi:glycoside hydrolase family 28 protein [Pantoea ananatis]|uniref:glycoside hydrolase family 28 protein n=1 Tax=Pantoea ananas TaxID=553 RepID=UPI0021F7E6B8|nr:glycoside hydrolase family 28 protein [Pantoea ananatis]
MCRSASILCAVLSVLMSFTALAGDRRTLTQPVSPPVCQRIYASHQTNAAPIIQQTLNNCPSGRMVLLVPSPTVKTLMSGPLSLPSGVSLGIDKGAVLSAIPDPRLYDNGRGSCGKLDNQGNGCRAFITLNHVHGSGIYGQGVIDGQGAASMAGEAQTWWQLAASAKNDEAKQNAPRLIQIDHASNITLYQITLKNAPNFHVVINESQGITLWGITIDTPATARNTDGVDPMGSSDVTLINSRISTGDDNVAIKAGNAPASHISILNNQFGFGHGMSIGSEINRGVSDVLVDGLTLTGTTNGLRIKSDRSRGGLVSAVRYQNVCMVNVENPILLDTHYDPRIKGSSIPFYRDITFDHVNAGNGKITLQGYSDAFPLEITLQKVFIGEQAVIKQENALIHGIFTRTTRRECP